MHSVTASVALLLAATAAALDPRQLPAEPTDVKTITSPTGIKIRYKEPGKSGVCETTPGVNSYSGYVDLAEDQHAFFWFFESRSNPSTDPITLWLSGGPGSDSMIALFQELGPCTVTEQYEDKLNPYSWTNVSNILFLSQPYGVGFSYQTEAAGSVSSQGVIVNASYETPTGRFPFFDPTYIDQSEKAAVNAWHVLQAFYSALPQLNSEIKSREFNLWTESYGGRYGPSFYDYFYKQNELIKDGTISGIELNMNSLGIINGLVDMAIQAPYWPEFAVNNTYGIKAYNDTIYSFANMVLNLPANGCLDQINWCNSFNHSSQVDYFVCGGALQICRNLVEGAYYVYSGLSPYDIRASSDDTSLTYYFAKYLNEPRIQNALGVDLNYTASNLRVFYAFEGSGDGIFTNSLADLEYILDQGVSVSLFYGDADYIYNWFGGEAISKAVNYTHTAEFNAAGYQPFLVDGKEYGVVRQYGNFSFARIYNSGHEIPFYQPVAALQLYNRSINGWDIATGQVKVVSDYGSQGSPYASYRETSVPLPSPTNSS